MKTSGAGDSGLELVSEMRAMGTSGAAIGTFDERRVREVANNISRLEAEATATLSNPHIEWSDPYYAALKAHMRAQILREKRCVGAYLTWRLKSITNLWWDSRDQMSSGFTTAAEDEYLRGMNATMVEYMTSFAVPLDLRAFTTRPPSFPPSNVVDVCGRREHTYVSPLTLRAVHIYPGKMCSVPFEDAETLVQLGVAEIVA